MQFIRFAAVLLLYATAEIYGKEEKKSEGADKVKNLLEVEAKLADKIEEYCDSELKRLEKLRKIAEEEKSKPLRNMANPVNAYLMVKRHIESDLMKTLRENSAKEVISDMEAILPSAMDLENAVTEIMKMQDEKGLDAKDIANGDIPGLADTRPLNVDECFTLGRYSYNAADYYHAIVWMEETLERIKLRKNSTEADKVPVLDYLAFALYQQGNVERAWWITKELLSIDPANERAQSNIGFYEKDIKEKKSALPKALGDLPPLLNSKPMKLEL